LRALTYIIEVFNLLFCFILLLLLQVKQVVHPLQMLGGLNIEELPDIYSDDWIILGVVSLGE